MKRIAGFCGAGLALVAATGLVGCSVSDSEELIGRTLQVTDVYDNPDLPSSVPIGHVPPQISLGGQSFSVITACGSYTGALSWDDNTLTINSADRTADTETECTPTDQTFTDRLLAALPGEATFTIDEKNRTVRFFDQDGMEDPNNDVIPHNLPGWSALVPE